MMIKIGDGFAFPENLDLSILDTIPVLTHRYGDPQPDVEEFRWMEYKSTTGNIGFARNVGAFFPAAAHHVVEYLAKLLPAGWPLDIHRVIFMRTIGGVQPHRDEGGRRCCINIGIRDADTSITRTSRDDNFDTFDTNYDDFVVENGSAYLLDVSRVHAVIEKRPARRLLISYGFGVPFADMLAKINHATLQPVATRTDVP